MTQYKQITIEILPRFLGFKVFEIELNGELQLFQVLDSLVEQYQQQFLQKNISLDYRQWEIIQANMQKVNQNYQISKKNNMCLQENIIIIPQTELFINETYNISLEIWQNELNTLEGPYEMIGSTTVQEILDFLLENIEITNKNTQTWTVSTQQKPNISINQNLYEIFNINTTSTFSIVTSQHSLLKQESQPQNFEIQPEPQTQFLPQTQWMQQKIKITIQWIDGAKKIDYKLDVITHNNFYDVKKRFLKHINISEEKVSTDFYLFGKLITNYHHTLPQLEINKNTIIQVKLRF